MLRQPMHRVRVLDTHTYGEPTRLVLEGGPDLGSGTMAEKAARLDRDFAQFRQGLVREPRGSDVWVGALVTDPPSESDAQGLIFFTTVGSLGMCGHGTLGVIESLRHLGRIVPGQHRFATPVGPVDANLHPDGSASIQNVESFRLRAGVEIAVQGQRVVGDVAFGGNWFFLVTSHSPDISMESKGELLQFMRAIRAELSLRGITGENGAEIDHVEIFGPSTKGNSKSFVLCPGGDYDRSPCGTGTSAKLACLHADGILRDGEIWRQEGFAGGVFEASCRPTGRGVIPTIRGRARVTAESTLLFDPDDAMAWGLA